MLDKQYKGILSGQIFSSTLNVCVCGGGGSKHRSRTEYQVSLFSIKVSLFSHAMVASLLAFTIHGNGISLNHEARIISNHETQK
jgi:hypothetical protein